MRGLRDPRCMYALLLCVLGEVIPTDRGDFEEARNHSPTVLKLQTAFACRVGQRRNSAMVSVVTTIESHAFDARGLRLLGDRGANLFRSVAVACHLDVVSAGFIPSTCGSKRAAAFVVDQLTIHVLVTAKDTQPWHFRASAQFVSRVLSTASLPSLLSFCLIHRFRSLIPNARRLVLLPDKRHAPSKKTQFMLPGHGNRP